MKYELFIAIRYLFSRQTASEPSLIALITTLGIALAVATLIGVLAVVGGFEGDLRSKMLSTRAHILITGESHGEVEDPEAVIEAIDGAPHVEAYSPFIETELMISSPTKYSIVVYRGVNPERIGEVSSLEDDMIEGRIDWLNDSSKALELRFKERFGDGEKPGGRDGSADPTMGDLNRLQQDIDNLQDRIAMLQAESDEAATAREDAANGPAAVAANEIAGDPAAAGEGAAADEPPAADEKTAGGENPLMPSLPAPRRTPTGASPDEDALRRSGVLMPTLPSPSAEKPLAGSRPGRALERTDDARSLPGIILGRGVQMSLRVLVGDTVNVINPDGDLGPSGPIPKSRPHRVVGIFFSGLLEYDETVGIVDMGTARELLSMPGSAVTGIEVRIDDMNVADDVARLLETRLAAAGLPDVEVRSWKEMNRSLFDALALEKVAIAFGIGTIFIVSFLLILLVLWMFVADKAREIALLKSIGATRGGIARIFIVQGALMGVGGGVLGLLVGMGFVSYAMLIGIPLPPEVYYIDRVPIEVSPAEVVMVLSVAIITSVAGAALPALQAAALDPVEGLRRD